MRIGEYLFYLQFSKLPLSLYGFKVFHKKLIWGRNFQFGSCGFFCYAKVKAFLFTFENATNLLHYTDMGAIS